MAEYLMNVRFNWSGNDTKKFWFKVHRNYFENLFMNKAYTKGADALNPHYEEWNENFEKEFPAFKNEDKLNPDSHYMNYIRALSNFVLGGVGDDTFDLFCGKEGQICGRIKGTDAEVNVVFYPVNR